MKTVPTTLTHSEDIADIAMIARACATAEPDIAPCLRQIAQRLDVARRQAEAMEYDKSVLLAHVPPHWIIDDGITIPRVPVLEDVL